jgi:branched-subunit amino acid aminotransferase/4-amino-4-deoxychorismate lyase
LGWTAVERQLAIDQVLNDAVEAFYTGTVAFVSPLTTINYQGIDHRIGDGKPGPRTLMLRQALNEIQLQERPDPWNWVTEVPT